MEQDFNVTDIEKYWEGTLNANRLIFFEKALLEDPDFAKTVALHGDVLQGFEAFAVENFKQDILKVTLELDKMSFFSTEEDIEAFWNQKLSIEEQEKMERRMKNNPKFAKEVLDHQYCIDGIELLGEQQLKDKIHVTEQELDAQGFFDKKILISHPPISRLEWKLPVFFKRIDWRNVFAVAASIILIFFIGKTLLFPARGEQDVFARYFQPAGDNLSEMVSNKASESGFGENVSEPLQKLESGLSAYNSSEYTIAIPIFETYLEQDEIKYYQERVAFYLAIAYLAEGKTQEAQNALKQLHKNTELEWRSEITWYLALSHVQNGEYGSARILLEQLNGNVSYREVAKKLQEALH